MSIIKINIHFSGAKLWNAIKEQLKSASRFRFKRTISHLQILIGVLYTANCVHSPCFDLLLASILCLFVCAFVDLLQLKIFSL